MEVRLFCVYYEPGASLCLYGRPHLRMYIIEQPGEVVYKVYKSSRAQPAHPISRVQPALRLRVKQRKNLKIRTNA